MITTGKKQIPWSWVILLTFTSGAAMLVETVSGNAMTLWGSPTKHVHVHFFSGISVLSILLWLLFFCG